MVVMLLVVVVLVVGGTSSDFCQSALVVLQVVFHVPFISLARHQCSLYFQGCPGIETVEVEEVGGWVFASGRLTTPCQAS